MRSQRSVVVTGVSTGIGRGITEVLTANGIRVFGSVRKRDNNVHMKQVVQRTRKGSRSGLARFDIA